MTLLPLMLLACVDEIVTFESVLTPISEDQAQRLVVSDSSGAGTVDIHVRLTNTLGASVPAEDDAPVYVRVEGPAVANQTYPVDLDGGGYGILTVATLATGTFSIIPTEGPEGVELGVAATGNALPADLPNFAIHSGTVSAYEGAVPTTAVTADGGTLVAAGDSIWWHPTEPGILPHKVVTLPVEVAGLLAGHIDDDGILDAVVWGGTQVILLRGREGGGLIWAGGFDDPDGTMAGVGMADLTGDRVTDLAVGIDKGSYAEVEILQGDGVWGFAGLRPLETDFGIESLTAADEDGDGEPEVSMISSVSGTVRRYTLGDQGWVGAARPEITAYEATTGAKLLPIADLNGDDTQELTVVGTPETATQDLVFFELGSSITQYPQAFGPFFPALADLNGDGFTDLLAMESDVLHAVYHDPSRDGYVLKNSNTMGEAGPIAVGQFTDDDTPDVAVFGATTTRFQRGLMSEDGFWTRAADDWTAFSTAVDVPGIFHDFSEDGIMDFVGLTQSDGVVKIVPWIGELSDSTLSLRLGSPDTLAVNGESGWGLVRCNKDFYALAGDGGSATIARVRIEPNGSSWKAEVYNAGTVEASMVACGPYDNGTQRILVASNTGAWSVLSNGMVKVDGGDLGSVYGVAIADTDGNGVGEVWGCSAADCSITAADLDGDGSDELIYGGSEVQIDWGEETLSLGGRGHVSTADVNGDGYEDVIATDGNMGLVQIWPNLAGELRVGLALHAERTIDGPTAFGDVSGDGIPEILFTDADGRMVHSAPSQ